MFMIEDDFHAELVGEKLETFEAALLAVRQIAALPFGEKPNAPPCTHWENCQRDYHILEYDDSQTAWQLIRRVEICSVSATGIEWFYPTPNDTGPLLK
jgi:hypothetical protein